MKKSGAILAIFILMFGIIAYAGLALADGDNGNDDSVGAPDNNSDEGQSDTETNKNDSEDEEDQENLDDMEENDSEDEDNFENQEREQEHRSLKFEDKERLRFSGNSSEIPKECEQEGAVLKCEFENGTREMRIMAGNSGNIIFQVKGDNVSTDVQLYQRNGTFYGQFRNNTKEIKYMPEQVRERLKEHIKAKTENSSFEFDLNEDGQYEVQLKKQSRLFGFISVHENVNAQVDPETGEVVDVKNPWWGFLASDISA